MSAAFPNLLAAHLVPGSLKRFTFDRIRGEPSIMVEHVSEDNRTWFDEQVALAGKSEDVKASKLRGAKPAPKGGVAGGLTRAQVEEWRRENREFLKKHVVRELCENVLKGDGKRATAEDIPAFVDALPNDLVALVILYASDPENFRPEYADPEELAGK